MTEGRELRPLPPNLSDELRFLCLDAVATGGLSTAWPEALSCWCLKTTQEFKENSWLKSLGEGFKAIFEKNPPVWLKASGARPREMSMVSLVLTRMIL